MDNRRGSSGIVSGIRKRFGYIEQTVDFLLDQIRTLKDLPISPIFAKTPHRVEALTWVILMAYLLYALLQYRVRQAVLQRGTPLRSPVRKKDMRPAGRSILDMLLTIQTVKIRLPDGSIARHFACNNRCIPDLLELLRIPKEVFITVPDG